MTESVTHYRRIDRLKAQAYELGFSNADAKEFGKLSKTATWESLLNFYEVDTDIEDRNLDSHDTSELTACSPKAVAGVQSRDTSELNASDLQRASIASNTSVKSLDTGDYWTNDGTFSVCNFEAKISAAASFLSWVDPLQLLACFLVSIGLFLLLLSVIPNPLKFVPSCVRINIQIGE